MHIGQQQTISFSQIKRFVNKVNSIFTFYICCFIRHRLVLKQTQETRINGVPTGHWVWTLLPIKLPQIKSFFRRFCVISVFMVCVIGQCKGTVEKWVFPVWTQCDVVSFFMLRLAERFLEPHKNWRCRKQQVWAGNGSNPGTLESHTRFQYNFKKFRSLDLWTVHGVMQISDAVLNL